jgi:hypothetical protein
MRPEPAFSLASSMALLFSARANRRVQRSSNRLPISPPGGGWQKLFRTISDRQGHLHATRHLGNWTVRRLWPFLYSPGTTHCTGPKLTLMNLFLKSERASIPSTRLKLSPQYPMTLLLLIASIVATVGTSKQNPEHSKRSSPSLLTGRTMSQLSMSGN